MVEVRLAGFQGVRTIDVLKVFEECSAGTVKGEEKA